MPDFRKKATFEDVKVDQLGEVASLTRKGRDPYPCPKCGLIKTNIKSHYFLSHTKKGAIVLRRNAVFLSQNKPCVGRKINEETREKLKISHIGQPGFWKGKELSAEHRQKLSKAHSGIPLSGKHKEKISFSLRGKPKSASALATLMRVQNTAEYRQKLRNAHLGRVFSLEHRRKISLSQLGNKKGLGKKKTQEAIDKIRAARAKQILPFRDSKPERIIFQALESLHFSTFLKHAEIPEFHSYYGRRHQFDVLIPSLKTAIEVDGCYWHGCLSCFPFPDPRQCEAREKDQRINDAVIKVGWRIVRLWEHEIIALDKIKKSSEGKLVVSEWIAIEKGLV